MSESGAPLPDLNELERRRVALRRRVELLQAENRELRMKAIIADRRTKILFVTIAVVLGFVCSAVVGATFFPHRISAVRYCT